MKKNRNAPPIARNLVESLRGIGYTTATAIADIIDNSISASATNVRINFEMDGEKSCISILDNGTGMDDAGLEKAMRLGAISPVAERRKNDLGRFGMGLKTASFSQCRSLTVCSKTLGGTTSLRWDLDVLSKEENDNWSLLEGAMEGSESRIEPLMSLHTGTLVLWEKMDRVVGPNVGEQDFLDMIDTVEQHLAMVFHRFLESNELEIKINGKVLSPWDPFLVSHPATQSSPEESNLKGFPGVSVQWHVLPHKDKLSTIDFEKAAGIEGWTFQQGFYVYRNKRLLVAGSWLGLGRGRKRAWTKEEAHKLARIRIDIPNTSDDKWEIDVRKSMAKPPAGLKERLLKLAEEARDKARRVFAHRGVPQSHSAASNLEHAWKIYRNSSGFSYKLDVKHPAIDLVLKNAGAFEPGIRSMLRVIEETVPVQQIWLDTTESKEAPLTSFQGQKSEDVLLIMKELYNSMILIDRLTPDRAKERMYSIEPFNNYPELIAGLCS